MSTRTAPWLVLLLLLTAGGCILGPQPEPPDVTIDDNLPPDEEADGGDLADGDGDVDTDIDDGYAGEDPSACDPDVAGGEWDCGCDREGHEPPGQFVEADADDFRVMWPGPARTPEVEPDDDTDETAYDNDDDPVVSD